MTDILDRVAAERTSFRPQTAQDFFALQLARKLSDVASVQSYVVLADSYPEEFLLTVYRNTLDQGRGGNMAERFRLELRKLVRKEGL